MPENENDLTPPKPDKSDVAHAITRSGLGSIPLAGTAATEILNAVVTPSLERRRNEWMEKVGESLRRLEEDKGINLEELQNNEEFIDIAMQASQAAIRTAREEKREALLNAILNTVLPDAPEESMRMMFINYIDTLGVWHMKFLDLFSGPDEWAHRNDQSFEQIGMGSLSTLIEVAFPEMRGQRTLYDQIGKDLAFRGLAQIDNLHVTMTGNGVTQKRTTEIGDQFIKFISNPIE